MVSLLERIAEFIVKEVQEESQPCMSGFQLIVSFDKLQAEFGLEIDNITPDEIIAALCDREEVADVVKDEIGFDVVLYTAYAPNYESIEEIA